MACKCLICEEELFEVTSFGKNPIANGFLTKNDFHQEYFFSLDCMFCDNCKMFQLKNTPDKEKMFNENYAFFSGTSLYMTNHFKNFAEHLRDEYLTDKSQLIVEIGCNDGIMLQNFNEWGYNHIGIEPSKNVADISIKKGLNIVNEFFDKKLAKEIVASNGKADLFVAANVMCHIPYFNSIIEGIDELISHNGIVVFEEPYLGDVIKKTTYDQIYDEHTFLFSITSINNAFKKFEMNVFHAERQTTHGGSMRYYICRVGEKTISKELKDLLSDEIDLGLDKLEIIKNFDAKCKNHKKEFKDLLEKIKSENKSIVGYGATSKSTTVLNYCNIGSDLINCIYDNTPTKINKFSPGKHIPIIDSKEFINEAADYTVLFAHNHSKEILEREKDYSAKGGKWILFDDTIRII